MDKLPVHQVTMTTHYPLRTKPIGKEKQTNLVSISLLILLLLKVRESVGPDDQAPWYIVFSRQVGQCFLIYRNKLLSN